MRIISCKKRGSKVSDQYSFCPSCQHPIAARKPEPKKETPIRPSPYLDSLRNMYEHPVRLLAYIIVLGTSFVLLFIGLTTTDTSIRQIFFVLAALLALVAWPIRVTGKKPKPNKKRR